MLVALARRDMRQFETMVSRGPHRLLSIVTETDLDGERFHHVLVERETSERELLEAIHTFGIWASTFTWTM